VAEVLADISMSLDGLVTDPNPDTEHPLDEDSGRLHDWMFARRTDADAGIRDEIYARTGAVVIGKRMFDLGYEPWGTPPFGMPVYVLTHERRESLAMQGGTTYTFVPEGIENALAQARAAAGDKDVGVWGGANVLRQYLGAGLIDQIQIHLVPLPLGDGVRLFEGLDAPIELELTRLIETAAATHLQFLVRRPG
jgi:dihydrofolate reductase